MILKPKVLDGNIFATCMYSINHNMYNGLDVQPNGLYHMGDSRSILNVEGFTLIQGLSLSFAKLQIHLWEK